MISPKLIQSIDPKNLALRMKVWSVQGNVTHVKLFWKDKTPILLSSQVQYIVYKPSYDVYGNISLTLGENPESKEFHIIKGIEDAIRKHDRLANMIESQTYIPSVNSEKKYWKLRSRKEDIYWFDREHSKVTDMSFLKSLIAPFRVRVIVKLDNMWINKYCYGFTFALHQVQICDQGFYISKSMFNKTDVEDMPECDYEKYRKMLKFGVPKHAVREKMLLDGICEDQISNIVNVVSHNTIVPQCPPPPPPPPPPLINLTKVVLPKKQSSDMSAIFKDINNGNFKLRAVKEDIAKPRKEVDLNNISRQFKVNLADLIGARNRLKPLQKVYHSHYVSLAPLNLDESCV